MLARDWLCTFESFCLLITYTFCLIISLVILFCVGLFFFFMFFFCGVGGLAPTILTKVCPTHCIDKGIQ